MTWLQRFAVSSKKKDIDLNWENVVVVGESLGALVLAAAIRKMDETPLAGLFAEPPLSIGAKIRQLLSSLDTQKSERDRAIATSLGLHTHEDLKFQYLFTDPAYPVLLLYGLQHEANNTTPTPTVITQEEIDSLPEHKNLITCGIKEGGHRVLNGFAPTNAAIFKGIMLSRNLGGGSRAIISFKGH